MLQYASMYLSPAGIAFVLGVMCSVGIGIVSHTVTLHTLTDLFKDEHTHETDEVHVHSDFLFYADGERVRFTNERYQSHSGQVLHPDMHFHDKSDLVIHRHAEGITLGEFFNSLGVTISSDCLTLDTGIAYCSDTDKKFTVYVNGEAVSDPSSYINREGDRILFYYGNPSAPELSTYQDEVSTESCIYSGLCPERGVPPPESCGLTCEI